MRERVYIFPVVVSRKPHGCENKILDLWYRFWYIFTPHAGIAQLVERNLAKVDVAGSNPVSRSVP